MRIADYLRLAIRNITRQKLRSALTIFAIVIGATSVTIMLTLVFSVRGFITNQFEGNGTFQQVVVSPQTDVSWGNNNGGGPDCQGCVKLTDSLVSKIAGVSHVVGIARQTNVNGIDGLFYNNQKLRVNQVVAYDANGIEVNAMAAGRDINAGDGSGVLTITSDYADKLGYKNNYQALIGKTINLNTQGFYTGAGSNPLQVYQQQQQYFSTHQGQPGQNYNPPGIQIPGTIVGIAEANGPANGNGYTVRVPLSWARGMEENQMYQVTQAAQNASNSNCQNIRGPCAQVQPKPTLTVTDELALNGYSSLIVKVDNSSNAAAVAKNIKNQFKVGAADAETSIKSQLATFNIIGYVVGAIGGIALMVAAVGVVNTMVMAILERTREIGVMRAVGAKRSTVSTLFTFEAALLGFMGGVIGIGVAYILTLIANPLINSQLKGNGIKSSNIVALPTWLIIGVIIITTLIGMLAGLYPARRAAKLDPVEALRYE